LSDRLVHRVTIVLEFGLQLFQLIELLLLL